MKDPLLAAKLSEIAASAAVIKEMYEREQHWPGELKKQLAALANKLRELMESVKQ